MPVGCVSSLESKLNRLDLSMVQMVLQDICNAGTRLDQLIPSSLARARPLLGCLKAGRKLVTTSGLPPS